MNKVYYELPASQIALVPRKRGESRLLHVRTSIGEDVALDHRTFKEIVGLMPSNAHIVFNNSRVLPARLWMGDPDNLTEVMLLQPTSPQSDPAVSMHIPCHGQVWTAMLRGGVKEVHPNQTFASAFGVDKFGFKVRIVEIDSIWEEANEEPGFEVSVIMETADAHRSVALEDALAAVGDIPIPPYLDRATIAADSNTYQTVYSDKSKQGSVAAPTAGLHFDGAVLQAFEKKGVTCSFVSLHVGAGTFKPVNTVDINDHNMHSERFTVTQEQVRLISQARANEQPLVCVGTTSVRLCETLYWCGVKKLLAGDKVDKKSSLNLGQWDYIEIEKIWKARYLATELPSLNESLDALLTSVGTNVDLAGVTSLCITPGYKFHSCDHLVTNFHQAESTLMALVSAFLCDGPHFSAEEGVKRIKHVYQEALDKEYQFLSYGDSMFIQKLS